MNLLDKVRRARATIQISEPGFFGQNYAYLKEKSIVKLKGWGLTELSQVYAIWHKDKIKPVIKDSAIYKNHKDISQKWKLYLQIVFFRVKYVSDLKFFETRKYGSKERVITTKCVKVDN